MTVSHSTLEDICTKANTATEKDGTTAGVKFILTDWHKLSNEEKDTFFTEKLSSFSQDFQKQFLEEYKALYKEYKEPALFITAQTSLNVRIASLLAMSLVVMGFLVSGKLEENTLLPFLSNLSLKNLPDLSLKTIDVALVLLGSAVLSLSYAAEACVKSHGADYYALSEGRRDSMKLSTRPGYIEELYDRQINEFNRAVKFYNIGLFFVLAGMGFLFYNVSLLASTLIWFYLVMGLAMKIVRYLVYLFKYFKNWLHKKTKS
jgi:hypothetical protein